MESCAANFSISWDPFISDPLCGLVSYNVTISSSVSDNALIIMNVTDDNFHHYPGLLSPNADYAVRVAGMNNAGVGECSIMQQVSTSSQCSNLPGNK